MDLNKKLEELKPYQLNCNVFDVYSYNGLTMQDLLCQFFTKINECITVSNETIDLAKWLVNEGLEIEVVKKLMMLLEDGTVEKLINVNLFKTLNNEINGLSSKLEHKANIEDVRLKSSSISVNDLDEETRQAILENNNIDINYVLGNDGVVNENIKQNTIQGDKVKFVNTHCQYVDYSTIVLDKYYSPGSISTVDSENSCIYPPFRIYSGITYYYKDLYAYFSTIKYDNGTMEKVSSNSSNFEGSFVAEDDGYLYCSLNKAHYNEGKRPIVTNNSELPNEYVYGDYSVSIPCLKLCNNNINDYIIIPKNTTFIKTVEQYIDIDTLEHGKYYVHGNINKVNGNNVGILEPFKIEKGVEYFYNDIYAYFSTIKYDNGTKVALSEETNAYLKGSFIAEDNGYLYVTINTTYDLETLNVSVSNSLNGLISSKVGVIGNEIINEVEKLNKDTEDANSVKTNIITVKKSGGDYLKVLDAVKSITDSSIKNQYEIHIYEGVYDLLEEHGGEEWINSIVSGSEMQGLLLPDYVHLIGHGSVYIDLIVPDDISTEPSSRRISTINTEKSNTLEGITFRARNTRYVIHDEANNNPNNANLTRKIKNCRFIHEGNKAGNWSSFKAMGGGTASGGRYEIINSHFESPFIPFSYHNNVNQGSNYMLIDGCTFKGNVSAYQYDVGFGYYKTNTEPFYITVKNCITDRDIKKYQETSSVESDDVIELTLINNIKR